jgi:hypothetical protein
MTVTVKALVQTKVLESPFTTQYTCTVTAAILDKISVYNNSSSAIVTLDMTILRASDSPGATNLLLKKPLQPQESYTCPEVSGQCMNVGDKLITQTSAVNIAMRVGGREIT